MIARLPSTPLRFRFALVLLLLAAGLAFAQEEGVRVAPFEADPIGGLSGEAADLASSVVVLRHDDLVAWGAKNVAEALAAATGAYVSESRVFPELQEATAALRGIGPHGVKVLVDGVPVGAGESSTVDLANLVLDDVAEIRVLTGPTSALYGGDTAGGVIHVVTRKAPPRIATNLQSEFGTGQTFDYRLNMGGTADFLSGTLSGSHQDSHGHPMPAAFGRSRNENGVLRNNSAWRRDHYAAKLGFALGEAARLQLQGSYFQADRDIPVDQETVDPRFFRYPHWRRWDTALAGRYAPFSWLSGSARVFWNQTASKFAEFLDADYQTQKQATLWRRDGVGGEIAPVLDFGKWSLIRLRAFYQRERAEVDLPGIDAERFETAAHSYALEWEMRPVRPLLVMAGASWDIFEGLHSDRGTTAKDLVALSPVASVTVFPVGALSLTLSGARKFRAPTLAELYLEPGANSELGLAPANLYELIVRWRWRETVALRVSAFREELFDLVRLLDPFQRGFTLDNRGAQRFHGGEVEVIATPIRGMHVRAAYTYVLGEELWNDAQTEHVLFLPAHHAFAEIRYRASFGLGGGYFGEAVSEQQFIAKNGHEETLGAYVLHGARIFYNYRDHLEVFVYGTNLADVYYERTRHYAQPGRRVFGGVLVQF